MPLRDVRSSLEGDACLAASTADTFQQTWLSLGTFPATSTGVTEKNYSCAGMRVTRQLPKVGRAPTVAAFQAILTWIG